MPAAQLQVVDANDTRPFPRVTRGQKGQAPPDYMCGCRICHLMKELAGQPLDAASNYYSQTLLLFPYVSD